MSRLAVITDDWRLKLLALGLALLMLGAVAFSQNPPTIRTLSVPLNYYFGTNTGIVVIKPPSTVNVTFSGLADVIGQLSANNLTATADASHAKPGAGVRLNVNASSTTQGVQVSNPAPILVTIDQFAEEDLTVQVVAHEAPGYRITSAQSTCAGATPCVVHFIGPQSWESAAGLRAVIVYSPAVAFTDIKQPSQPILLETNSGPFDTSRTTEPSWGLDVSTADIHIVAAPGTTSTTIALVVGNPSQLPPPGYEITGITVSPSTIVITGDPISLGKIQRILLPGPDLSGATSTTKVQINIPYPDGVTPLNGEQTATVTYTIQRNPSVTPSP